MPTRGQMRRIRRNARKLGISQPAAFDIWHAKQAQKALKQLDSPSSTTDRKPIPNHDASLHLQTSSAALSNNRTQITTSRVRDVDLPVPSPREPLSQSERLAKVYFQSISFLIEQRGFELRRQRTGLYLLLDRNRNLVTNPFDTSSFDFTAEQVDKFLRNPLVSQAQSN